MNDPQNVGLMATYMQQKDLVKMLTKSPTEIKNQLDEKKVNALHMVLGVAGEAGELVDCVKKYAIYNQELNTENLIEELGDLIFYITGLLNQLGIPLADVMVANQNKLRKRYLKGYSDQAAKDRVDKE